jgi:hypothetical protein
VNREEDFRAGIELLTPLFEQQDFALKLRDPFDAEDGTYYSAQFVWGNHAVTLVHHFGLSSVTYSVGAMLVEHEAYLVALGVRPDAGYPTQSDDPIAGYRGLLGDLEGRLRPYFEEPDREFMEIAEAHGRRGRPWLPGS